MAPVLLQKQELALGVKSAGGELVEIHAAWQYFSLVVAAASLQRVGAGRSVFIKQKADVLSGGVINRQPDLAGFGDVKLPFGTQNAHEIQLRSLQLQVKIVYRIEYMK
ncbi:hypothetical protein KC799_10070 [candidate division KSB1 bacterium]|nr:hypothetical protein [candidate division KSB1 bacterium]